MSLENKATELVNGSRQDDYGDPVESMTNIGKAWSGILRTDVAATQVALCLAAMKLVRFGYKSKGDSIVDAVGYCEIAKRCDEAESDTELEPTLHVPNGFEFVSDQRRQVMGTTGVE